MKTRLLSQMMAQADVPALEEVPQAVAEAAAAQPPAPSATEAKLTHVEGPLSVVYARALNEVYAVNAPVGLIVDNANQIGSNATLESAAMDEMIAMQAHATTIERLQNLVHSGDGDSLRVYTTGVATQDQADSSVNPRAQAIFDDLANYVDPSDPVNFVFVESCQRPSEDSPISAQSRPEMLSTALPEHGRIEVGVESTTEVNKIGEVPSAVPERRLVVEGPQGDTVQPAAQGARILVQQTYLTDPQREAYERGRNAQMAGSPDPQSVPYCLEFPLGTKADEPKLVDTLGARSNFAIESITVIIKTKRVS